MKNKRAVMLFLATVILCITFVFSADASSSLKFKNFTYTVLENETVKITEFTGEGRNCVIPSKIDGMNVTVIGQMAFNSCKNLEKLTIPGTVTDIEDYAVAYCPKLSSITVKAGKLKRLQCLDFYCCRGLKTVKLPKNIVSLEFFFDCSDMENVVINSENKNLRSFDGVVYSKNLKTLIYYPPGKDDTYFIVPSDVDNIRKDAFYGAKNLQGIYIPKTVKSIGETAFAYTTVTLYYEGSSVPAELYPAMYPWNIVLNSSALKKVQKITAEKTTETVTLKWGKVMGASGYRVYIYDFENKIYKTLANTKKTSYEINNLKPGTSYRFAVKPYASTVSGTAWAKSYTQVTVKTIPYVPYFLPVSGNKQITVSITPVNGADGYIIYWSTDKDGTYKKLAEVKKNGSKKVSFTKKNLKSGTAYYLKVRAYIKSNGKYAYGGLSAARSVVVK